MREWKDQAIVVVVPRLIFGLTQGAELQPVGEDLWQETIVPLPRVQAGSLFRNVVTRETVAAIAVEGKAALKIGQVLKMFPVALLEKFSAMTDRGCARRLPPFSPSSAGLPRRSRPGRCSHAG